MRIDSEKGAETVPSVWAGKPSLRLSGSACSSSCQSTLSANRVTMTDSHEGKARQPSSSAVPPGRGTSTRRLYPDRAARRHCHHRYSFCHAVAGALRSKSAGAIRKMQEQLASDEPGLENVCG